MEYNNNAAALKFEIINEKCEIGNWNYVCEDSMKFEVKDGCGVSEILNLFVALNKKNKINVIYVKNLMGFELIGENYFTYDKFKANGERTFYSLKINGFDFIELRDWDSFFDKEEDPVVFLKKIKVLRNLYKIGRKNELGLGSNLNYTISRHMWLDIAENYFLYGTQNRDFVKECLPKTPNELDLLVDIHKGGYYMVNNNVIEKTIENVYSFDSSSCHISLMARKPFPYGGFTEEIDENKIEEIIKLRHYSWIGEFIFYNLEKKVNLPINIIDYGKKVDDKFVLILTDVDFEWFCNVFKFSGFLTMNFFYSKRKILPRNLLLMFDDLYRTKEAQKKGSFAKELSKFRAELPYGQSIKKPFYEKETYYDENDNTFKIMKKGYEFNDVINSLKKRNLPYQLGIWTVAYSRLELIKLIFKIGIDKVIYADTDSVKFIGEEGLEIMKKYNNEIDEEFAAVEDKTHIKFLSKMGRWQFEGKYSRFKALGVKWYLVEENG